MATDVNSFLDTIATFLGKTTDYFGSKTGRPDVLLNALNHAKLFAQRGQDFERNRVTCSVSMFPPSPDGSKPWAGSGLLYGGADLRNAINIDTAQAVNVNKINAAYWKIGVTGEPFCIDAQSAQNVDFNCAFEQRPLTLISGKALSDRKRKMLDLGVRCLQNGRLWAPWGFNRWDPFLYRENQTLYLCPVFPQPVEITLDVIQWMTPYGYEDTDSTVTCDWLLEFGSDFLLYRAISELNVFLKEDDRLNISQSKMTEAWINLTAWDSTMINGDENLD